MASPEVTCGCGRTFPDRGAWIAHVIEEMCKPGKHEKVKDDCP